MKIQIIDVQLFRQLRIKNEFTKWKQDGEDFCLVFVKLDDGDIIFLKHYWVNETFMQNPIMVQKDTW